MKTKKVSIIDNDERTGVYAVSFVKNPAIKSGFVKLSAEEIHLDGDKQVATGPILIPDLAILRRDENGEPYNMEFSAEVIERIVRKFHRKQFGRNSTHEHQSPLEGITMIESWLVEDPTNDKSAALGIPQSKGTWMGSFYVESRDYWDNEVKSGNVKGFSIEGIFQMGEEELSTINTMTPEQIQAKFSELLKESGLPENVKSQLTELQNSVNEKTEKITELEGKLSEAETAKGTFETKATEAETKLTEAETTIETLKAEKKTAEDKVAELTAKVEELSEEPIAIDLSKEIQLTEKVDENESEFEKFARMGAALANN